MKTTLAAIIILLATLQASAQLDKDFKMPATWQKDFTITASYGGSMDGSNTEVRFTYDSCIYKRNRGMTAPKTTVYLLKEADRVAILKKLTELKVDKIDSDASKYPVNDGWSTSLCFGYHCVSAGTSYEISDADKAVFNDAYNYLEQFATANAKKKLK